MKILLIAFCCLIGIRAKVLQTDSNGIFAIPTRIMDDADLLEEHGRFMSANMNPTIDPCENFFEFACGNWQNDSMVPLLGRNQSLFDSMTVKVNELILEFLKNKTGLKENSAETKMKQFFDSCINVSPDLSEGYRTIYNYIKEPILKDGENLHWMVLNFYPEISTTPLLPLNIRYNYTSYVYEIFLGDFNELTALSTFNITKISEDFKFENKEAVAEEWEELKSFEKKLVSSVTTTNYSRHETLEEFLKVHNSSDLNLEKFFDLAFNGTTQSSWKINYNIINFTDLAKFLTKSDTGVLFNYVRWKLILRIYELMLLKDDQIIEQKCQHVTIHYFKNTLIPWFIETTFDEDRRADGLKISKHLKDTFYSLIDQATWLDSETKSAAKSKLRAMDVYIGYTDEMRDRSELDEQFKGVNITKNVWENLINLNNNIARNILTTVGKASVKADVDIDSTDAFYNRWLNQAYMLINMFQLPLYHINLPNSLKFAGIGSVIAHEMAHGFDSRSYKYDYDGKERNWWTPQSLMNFKERYQCLESQYNKFIYEGVRTNGKQTSRDNIADNVGLKIAYQSYLRFLDENGNLENGKDKPLPGLDFSNKHLFFLKFAQNWCDGESADIQMEILTNDEHSINKFRVIGTLMNMPEFSEEYGCALGTYMNPLKKCIIYGSE